MVNARQLATLARKTRRASLFYKRNTVASLIARIDEFTAEILRTVYLGRRELLSDTNRTLSYDEIGTAESVEDIIGTFVQAEIDSFLHDSHEEQIRHLDQKFKLGIHDHFSKYPAFIELVERRHLYVHTGARVGKRYLAACRRVGVDTAGIAVGDVLSVDDKYVEGAAQVVFELGIRLGQGVVRRVFPDAIDDADSELINAGLRLMQEEEWEWASTLFSFACNLPPKLAGDDSTCRVCLMNQAICDQALGAAEPLAKVKALDWSSSHPKFHIVLAALERDYSHAMALMVRHGKKVIDEVEYREWPAFREFRETTEFRQGFKAVFKREYVPKMTSEEASIVPTSGRLPAKRS